MIASADQVTGGTAAEATEIRPRVLIVDDVPANLALLEAALGHMNCELHRASSGDEALRMLLRHDFAVMLLDVHMPGMDGYEVARFARDNPATKDVPIVFVTATHQTEMNAFKGYGAGFVDVLFKPLDATLLRSKVRVFVELHATRAALRRTQEELSRLRAG